VKNPLQTMLMGLDYLSNRLKQPDENLATALKDMREAVKRADTIILELLALSANAEFHWVLEDLNAVIERSLRLIKNALISMQITVVPDLAPNLPQLPMDPLKLQQVFINILLNAIQAMSRGGMLTVRTHALNVDHLPHHKPAFRKFKPGETVAVTEVQDSGPGFTEAALDRAFDPFFTTKPVGVGTGLGLSVAKKIIDLHNGAIEIANARDGGALVTIVLKT
jgi:two-component system NtrC family sensor kinase